jgi:small subunit ribosomal protein S16
MQVELGESADSRHNYSTLTFWPLFARLSRMLTIRFQRRGRKNDASFRIVVLEKARSPKAGNPLQVLGSYNPKTKHTVIDGDSIKHWISKGAELSGTVNNLLITKGIIQGKKINVLGKKTAPKKEEEAKAVAPKEEAVAEAPAEAPAEEVKAES